MSVNYKDKKSILFVILLILIISITLVVSFVVKNKKNIKIDEYQLVLLGDLVITIYEDEQYIEPGYYVLKNQLVVNEEVAVTKLPDTLKIGTYNITYMIHDIRKERTIKVIKKEDDENEDEKEIEKTEGKKIEFKLTGKSEIIINKGDTYNEPGFIATCDDLDISSYVKIDGIVNTKIPGIYTINYSLNYDNEVKTIKRTVVVLETIKKEELQLSLDYSKDYTNQGVKITVKVSGTNFSYLKLPDGTVSENKNMTYTASKNGTYNFVAYDKEDKMVSKNVTINNIDTEKPTGSCQAKVSSNKTTITVNANDNVGIKEYLYNNTYKSNETSYTLNKAFNNVQVTIYDKAGNSNKITCKDVTETVDKKSNIEMHFIVTSSDDDAILIRTDSATIMIDGGRYEGRNKVISYLNKIGVKKIDVLIGSHVQYNHIQAQGAIIDNFSVSSAIYSIDILNCKKNGLCNSNDIKYVLDSIKKKNIKTSIKNAGDKLVIGDMKLYFIGPLEKNKRHNKNSLIFILEHNGKKYMFAGDAETDTKKYFDLDKFNSYAKDFGITMDIDFFKWPHHGIETITESFFKATTPDYVLIPNFHGCRNITSSKRSLLNKYTKKYYELCDGVNVVLESDGGKITMKKVKDPSSYKK